MCGLKNDTVSVTSCNSLQLTAHVHYLLFLFNVLFFFSVMVLGSFILMSKVNALFVISGFRVIILMRRDFKSRFTVGSDRTLESVQLFCLYKTQKYANAIVVLVQSIISRLLKNGWSH